MRSIVKGFSAFSVRKLSPYYSIGGKCCFSVAEKYADLKFLPPDELQKELLKIKRKMLGFYNTGSYEEALEYAETLQTVTDDVMGKDNAVYASSLNNVALMNKMLGNNDIAMDKYISALHIYEDVSGKQSTSYAATLTNLGVLYKSMAEMSKGEDKLQLLERADEALTDSTAIRTKLLGPKHKETLQCSIHLASTKRVLGKFTESEEILRRILVTAESTYGELDIIMATIYNNLGLTLKFMQVKEEAKTCYEKALEIYRDSVGDAHPEAITTRHNLAELHILMGEDEKATEIQEYLLEMMDITREEADKAIEELEKAAIEREKKQREEDSGIKCTTPEVEAGVEGVRVDKTPSGQQQEDADELPFRQAMTSSSSSSSPMQQQMDVLEKHQAYLNSPEFKKKVDYDNIPDMTETDLGFAPMSGPAKFKPQTNPATRKKTDTTATTSTVTPKGTPKDDSNILALDEVPVDDDESPFAKPLPSKRK